MGRMNFSATIWKLYILVHRAHFLTNVHPWFMNQLAHSFEPQLKLYRLRRPYSMTILVLPDWDRWMGSSGKALWRWTVSPDIIVLWLMPVLQLRMAYQVMPPGNYAGRKQPLSKERKKLEFGVWMVEPWLAGRWLANNTNLPLCTHRPPFLEGGVRMGLTCRRT